MGAHKRHPRNAPGPFYVINGVTDAAGNRPVFDFTDSRTAPGSATVFGATPAYGESLGGIVIKRGKGTGFSGIENTLFFMDNTRMLYGDGQKAAAALIQGIKQL